MLDDITILAMLLCVALAVIGFKFRSLPVMVMSSLGWVILAIQLYQEFESVLVLALMMMVAIAQTIMVIR